MIFGLSSVVGFLEIHMSVLSDYLVTNSNVRLHGAKWILLLNEVNAYVSLPTVGAGLVKKFEVLLFAECFQAKEDESS
jgi:hypothetical protein